MIEMDEVWTVLATDEGATLLSEYTELLVKSKYPEHADDDDFIEEVVVSAVAEEISKNTVPEGVDIHQYILEKLEENIEELRAANDASPVNDDIPPRPLPNGSRFLNPEEINWLLKYDPKVKSSAEHFVRWYRREHGDTCNYLTDDMIVESILGTLYKLNRRDPSTLERIPGAGPSFFKQYEEGTPEEIVIRYFDSYSGEEDRYTADFEYAPDPARKAELLKQKKHNQTLGIVFLFLCWPIGLYFFYKASKITKEIDALESRFS